MEAATARAGANIALVKYWGKRDARLNLPAAGSISITLEGLETRTTVALAPALEVDALLLDGQPASAERIIPVLDRFRAMAGADTRCRVTSENSFPTGAGLASSASGFAALVVAANAVFETRLEFAKLSEQARLGSGSAARSIFGGFVEMDAGQCADGHDAIARSLAEPHEWPLEVVVAITDVQAKSVSSTDGMNHTMSTSPYYPAWVESVPPDLEQARQAIAEQDFEKLAEVSEYSALKMHASALAARPGLLYWNAATLHCLEEIRAMRHEGIGVFFTIDAGPQVKAVCLPGQGQAVAARLHQADGVIRVIRTGLGPGGEIVP